MIRYSMDLSDEKKKAAIEIALESKGNIRRRKIVTPILLIVGILELIIGGFLCTKNGSASGAIIIVIGILMLLLALKAKSFQRCALKKAESLLDSAFRTGITEYIFEDDGIQVISQIGNGKNYWNAFREYGVMGQYIYVKRKDNKMILIDRNDLSRDEIEELTELLSSNINNRHK